MVHTTESFVHEVLELRRLDLGHSEDCLYDSEASQELHTHSFSEPRSASFSYSDWKAWLQGDCEMEAVKAVRERVAALISDDQPVGSRLGVAFPALLVLRRVRTPTGRFGRCERYV